jgi:hypothetical protein
MFTIRRTVFLFLLLLMACAKAPVEGEMQRYEVEGILTQLPDGESREMMIRHVAIPDFVSAKGDTVGMDAMTMGFPTVDGLDLEHFAVGDSIRFVFEVRWNAHPRLRVTSIEALPAGTPLVFEKVSH